MNSSHILQFNVIPHGKQAWLSYDHYQHLKHLFEAINLPCSDNEIVDSQYLDLYLFLTKTAKLQVPINESAIHFNAFALIRRGYQVEEITFKEYHDLLRLMDGIEQAHPDDLELHPFGGHRDLYNYLTKKMGLSVQAGRGPVWHRAKALIDKYELTDKKELLPQAA